MFASGIAPADQASVSCYELPPAASMHENLPQCVYGPSSGGGGDPAKRPLDRPAPWDHHKALLAARLPANLQQIVNAVRKQGIAQLGPFAALIGEQPT